MRCHHQQLGYCGRCGLPFEEVGIVRYHHRTLPICQQCAKAAGILVGRRWRTLAYCAGAACTLALSLALCFFYC